MINLDTISDEILKARGAYSTVRAAREDVIKELQRVASLAQTIPQQILKSAQEDGSLVDQLQDSLRQHLHTISVLTNEIASLTAQRDEIKPLAWPK